MDITKILFFDIETVTEFEDFKTLSLENSKMSKLWSVKQKKVYPEFGDDFELGYKSKATFHPEYSKICCIGFEMYDLKTQDFKSSALCSDNESDILSSFVNIVNTVSQQRGDVRLCGQNIKKFDIPFVCRRIEKHGLTHYVGAPGYTTKPWDLQCIDLSDMWKFGDGSPASLDELAMILDLPSPKDGEVNGGSVGEYYRKGEYGLIADYCIADVVTSRKVFEKLNRKYN